MTDIEKFQQMNNFSQNNIDIKSKNLFQGMQEP